MLGPMNRSKAVLALTLLAAPLAASAAQIRAYVGEARSADDALIYEEHHLVRLDGEQPVERLVTYRCTDGQPFARKLVTYGNPVHAPTFRLDDHRFGYVEGFDDGVVFVRAGTAAEEQRAVIKASAALVVDAGFDEFVREHWDTLQRGASVPLEFLVPSRLSSYKFKLRKVRSEAMFGAPASVFELAVSGLLGWFADPLEVGYRDSDRRLMHFKGLTNIRKTLDSNIVAQIRFPPAREDDSQTQASIDTARAEPLQSCSVGG